MAARFVPTMRLSNIIQMITLSSQSGILRAIRGQESARQMGQIRFMNGQAVSVLFGQMVGENAMNALMGWGECMYSFDEIASDGAEPDGYYSSSDGAQYGTTPLPSGTGSWPSYGGYPSSPSYAPSSPPQYPPNPGPPSPYPPYGTGYPQQPPNTGYPQQPPNTGYPQQPPNTGYPQQPPNTGYPGGGPPNPSDPNYWQTPPTPTASSLPGSNGFRPDLLESVPYQVGIAEPIEHLPLDRRERMILLLINGQRSMMDLVRLTHRGEREIYAVLQHLALLGLIQFRR